MLSTVCFWLLVVLAVFSVFRLIVGLLLANVHDISALKAKSWLLMHNAAPHHRFSIVIPAFNEEKTIERCVQSVFANHYAAKQVIVVNDGSTDNTPAKLRLLQSQYPGLIVINQANSGKAAALNNAIFHQADGDLVMVLDADSWLASDALSNMNLHFANRHLIGASCNVKIGGPIHHFVERVQQLEYLFGYHIKGSEQVLRLIYIIGGVGSTFRRQAILDAGGYDTNTVTEDIDLTVKLIAKYGNLHRHFAVASDVIAYTPPCHNFFDLLKQRLRWKAGRFTTLFKYHQLMFCNKPSKYSWTLTCWKLPKVFFEELLIFLDPFLTTYMLWMMVYFANPFTVISLFGVYAIVTWSCIFADDRLKRSQWWLFMIIAPISLLFMYVINLTDFISLLRCLKRMPQLARPRAKAVMRWEHVQR